MPEDSLHEVREAGGRFYGMVIHYKKAVAFNLFTYTIPQSVQEVIHTLLERYLKDDYSCYCDFDLKYCSVVVPCKSTTATYVVLVLGEGTIG